MANTTVDSAWPDTLTIHYRRPARDYGGWELWVWPLDLHSPGGAVVRPLVTPPRPPPEDAFGVVFRVPIYPHLRPNSTPTNIGLLPRTPAWAEQDAPDRHVDLHALLHASSSSSSSFTTSNNNNKNHHIHSHVYGHSNRTTIHLYMLQGDPRVAPSPLHFTLPADPRQSRFLLVLLDTLAAPWTDISGLSSRAAVMDASAEPAKPSSSLVAVEGHSSLAEELLSKPFAPLHWLPTQTDKNHPRNDPFSRSTNPPSALRAPRTWRPFMRAHSAQRTSRDDPSTVDTMDVFPAPSHVARLDLPDMPELFIVDRAFFPTEEETLVLELVSDDRDTELPVTNSKPQPTATWSSDIHSNVVNFILPMATSNSVSGLASVGDKIPQPLVSAVCETPTSNAVVFDFDMDEPEKAVNELLAAQADCFPGVCKIEKEAEDNCHHVAQGLRNVTADSSLLLPFVDTLTLHENNASLDPYTLYVHYRTALVRQDGYEDIGLSVKLAGNGAVSPTTERHRDQSFAELAGAAAIFTVELALLTDYELRNGFLITPISCRSGAPRGATTLWKPSFGNIVILAEGQDRLLTPGEADISFYYHRFDDFADWRDWELHVWTEANAATLAMSTVVKPTPPDVLSSSMSPESAIELQSIEGVILFRMLSSFAFPEDAALHIQPIKMTMASEGIVDSAGEETANDPSRRESTKKDVVRQWVRDRNCTSTVHIIQADSKVQIECPDRSAVVARRYVSLRYYRFEDPHLDEWDLWSWDAADAPSTRRAVSPVLTDMSDGNCGPLSRYSVDFVIDRSWYGGGASIYVLPRRGGDTWTQKDEPPRLLAQECSVTTTVNLNASPVVIVEGCARLLNQLDDAKSMLGSDVDGDSAIMIRAPIPFEWMRSGSSKEKWMPTPNLTILDRNALSMVSSISQGLCSLTAICGGKKTIFCEKVTRVSATSLRCHVKATFEEDYLVENVLVSIPGFDPCALDWRRHDNFDDYYYSGPLGWDYSSTCCTFRCFAPAADSVSVVLYDAPVEGRRTLVPMRRIPEGCWKTVVSGDLKGTYYKLLAEGNDKRLFPGVEVIDPYSRCNTSHVGRGLIFGVEDTPVTKRPSIRPEHTIVYELHVRDLTIDEASGVSYRGKFLGLTERGTKLVIAGSDSKMEVAAHDGISHHSSSVPGAQFTKDATRDSFVGPSTIHDTQSNPPVSVDMNSELHHCENTLTTALDHIIEMGVTAVQLMPVQDFDNDESDNESYRWGYMPVHFNSPDGWYATETSSIARVTELKRLVDAFHRAGVKVIMDVVYNHTAEDGNELNLEARFSFNGLAPRYYYRNCVNTPVAHSGESTCALGPGPTGLNCGRCVSNGSGCGNEFRSESPMGRKFIIDSLKFWVTEYMIDGFRFDLMGLIDVETLTVAAKELRAIDPNIIMYGEPWCGGLTPIRSTEKGMQRSRGFGVFNNTFRDALRGSPFGIEETFVMDGGRINEVKRGIIGSIDDFADKPQESINYVECHDNYTLWDHMQFYISQRTDDIKFTADDCERIHRLAAVVIFTSQGIPLIQAGQEMCRTKFGDENSYQSPDSVNMIRWISKQERLATVRYYQGLIALRRAHPELFCLKNAKAVRSHITFFEDLGLSVPSRCIAFQIWTSDSPRVVVHSSAELSPLVTNVNSTPSELKWVAIVVLLNPNPTEEEFGLPEQNSLQHWVLLANADVAGVDAIGAPLFGGVRVAGRSAAILRRASRSENDECLLNIRLDSISDPFSVPVDDVPSLYVVGLSSHRTESEQGAHETLVRLRQEFLGI